jgi:hypothetical protein
MGSDKEDLQRWADLVLDGKPINIDQTLRQQAARIAELEAAVKVLGIRIRAGCDLGEFMRNEYPKDGQDRKTMNRRRNRLKNSLFIACEDLDNNPIAAAAVRKASDAGE